MEQDIPIRMSCMHLKLRPSFSFYFQGPYTREDGFLGYNEICEEQLEQGRKRRAFPGRRLNILMRQYIINL